MFRVHMWFDIEKMSEKWGIQIKHDNEWHHCCKGSEPLIYDNIDEAKRAMKILKKMLGTPAVEGE